MIIASSLLNPWAGRQQCLCDKDNNYDKGFKYVLIVIKEIYAKLSIN